MAIGSIDRDCSSRLGPGIVFFPLLFLAVLAELALAATYPRSTMAAEVIYVSIDGSDTAGDGSPGNPYMSITRGMSEATTGSTIHVGEGTYSESTSGEDIPIALRPGVSLLGSGAASTTIDGEHHGPILEAEGFEEMATIDGFTMTEAWWNGALQCADAALRVSHNTIRGNMAAGNGAGLHVERSRLFIVENIVAGNTAYQQRWYPPTTGGGIYCANSEATITGNAIISNWAGRSGGGIRCSGRAFISGNTVRWNNVGTHSVGGHGGGIACTAEATIANNVIANNGAHSSSGSTYEYYPGLGGGIFCTNATVVNNTIVGNSTANSSGPGAGGGIHVADGEAHVVNCIIWNNGDDLDGCSASYSDISNAPDAAGVGNIHSDPGFVDADGGDYHLAAESICVDTGTNPGAPQSDGDGATRPQDGEGDGVAVADIGAYERAGGAQPADGRAPTALALSCTPSILRAGEEATLSATLSMAGTGLADRSVSVWKKIVGSPWSHDGTATFDAVSGTYEATRRPDETMYFKFAFGGDESHQPAASNAVCVDVLSDSYVSLSGSDDRGNGEESHPYRTITKGISEALPGETVHVSAGTFSAGEAFPIRLASGVILQGSGASTTVIEANERSDVVVADGADARATIDGFTITGGGSLGAVRDVGSGIVCSNGASPTVSNNVITGNLSDGSGGGIRCESEACPTIRDNTISGNTTNHWGGGVSCVQSSNALISSNRIADNTGGTGGGIASDGSHPTIIGNTITGNRGGGCGGGMELYSYGGVVRGNTIKENTAGYGGGISTHAGTPQVFNNVIAGNHVEDVGGGIAVNSGTGIIFNNTIVGNGADYVGGGIVANPACEVFNCVIWGNGGDDLSGCSAAYSDISSVEDSSGTGNICADPEFVNPTSGDYHLGRASTCIDAGTNTDAPLSDKDGVARPQDGDADGVAMTDIGAYEVVRSGPRIPSELALSAQNSVVGYSVSTVLSAALSDSSGPITDRVNVRVWRRPLAGGPEVMIGAARYNSAIQRYEATCTCAENTVFRMRYAGDARNEPADSNEVMVTCRAKMSNPWTYPRRIRRGRTMYVFGHLWPRSAGYTRVRLYRKVRGGWRHVALRYARNYDHRGHTRYRLGYRLNRAGWYRVVSFHVDASHVRTRSSAWGFYVR